MTGDQYEPITTKYEPRMLAYMGRLKQALEAKGFTTGDPWVNNGDTFTVSLEVYPGKTTEGEPLMGYDFKIWDKADFDGQEDDNDIGLNFAIDAVKWGGQMLGGFSPFNFTEQCWVNANDPNAVEERFKLIEALDVAELVSCADDAKKA